MLEVKRISIQPITRREALHSEVQAFIDAKQLNSGIGLTGIGQTDDDFISLIVEIGNLPGFFDPF